MSKLIDFKLQGNKLDSDELEFVKNFLDSKLSQFNYKFGELEAIKLTIKTYPRSYIYLSSIYHFSEDFHLNLLLDNHRLIEYYPEYLLQNLDFLKNLCIFEPRSLNYIHLTEENINYLSIHMPSFVFSMPSLLNNPEYALSFIKNAKSSDLKLTFDCIPSNIKNEKFLLECIEIKDYLFYSFDGNYKKDPSFVLKCVNHGLSYEYIPEYYKNDKKFILECINYKCEYIFPLCEFTGDIDVCIKAISICPTMYHSVDYDLKKDIKFLQECYPYFPNRISISYWVKKFKECKSLNHQI